MRSVSTRSPPASLSIKGQFAEQTNIKWFNFIIILDVAFAKCQRANLGTWELKNTESPSARHFFVVKYSNCQMSSAYDMKNIFCLFERPFKIQKDGVFLFEISFSVLEILTFFYYAN